MNMRYNGILVQDTAILNKITKMEFIPKNYRGIHLFYDDPLISINRTDCKQLQNERMFNTATENIEICNQFISDLCLAKKYIAKCLSLGFSVRILFIESQYPYEIWKDAIPPLTLLGYEVTEIPLGVMTLHDLCSKEVFEEYKKQLNEHGLFSHEKEAYSFMNDYKAQLAKGLVGDGEVEVYVCKVYEASYDSIIGVNK